MVRSVKSRAETAKKWNRVITWMEIVCLDVNLGCMVWSVINRAATVATGICVMKWTEVVNLDVTLVFMARSAALVIQFIYQNVICKATVGSLNHCSLWCDVCAYVYMWNKCSTICRKSNEYTIIQRVLRRYLGSKQKRNNNICNYFFF